MKWIADQIWVLANRGFRTWFYQEAGLFYLVGRLVHRPSESIEVEGVRVALPRRRLGIADELLGWGTREPISGGIYLKLLRPNDVVFEVGVNIGWYAILAAPNIPGGSIHAFEPDPGARRAAKENLVQVSKIHSIPFRLSPYAVADRIGHATFYRTLSSNHGSLLPQVHSYHIGTIEVPTITLDEYCKQNDIWPTVVRMDIEGGEFAAFRGMKEVLEKHPFLFVEVHDRVVPRSEVVELFQLLVNSGYEKAILVWQPDYPWTPARWRRKLVKEVELADGIPDRKGFRLLTGREES